MSYFAELSMRHLVLPWKVFKGLWYHIHPGGEVFTDSPKQEQVVMAIDLAKHRHIPNFRSAQRTAVLTFLTEPQDRQMLGILLFCWHPKAHDHTT